MKKILITILATFALAGVSHAGSFGVGVSGGVVQVEGSGSETTTAGTVTGGAANTNSHSEKATSVIGSIFAEYEFDNGFTVGYEHVPGSADVSAKHSRRDDAEDAAGSGTSGDTTSLSSCGNCWFGSAVYIAGATTVFSAYNSMFDNHKAGRCGGAIYGGNSATLFLESSTVEKNWGTWNT